MTTDYKIRDEKLQYDINKEAQQHYLKVKLMNVNILQKKKYNQSAKKIGQSKFTHYFLGKALEKQKKKK